MHRTKARNTFRQAVYSVDANVMNSVKYSTSLMTKVIANIIDYMSLLPLYMLLCISLILLVRNLDWGKCGCFVTSSGVSSDVISKLI